LRFFVRHRFLEAIIVAKMVKNQRIIRSGPWNEPI
jgi:hypothetical protein